MSAYGNQYQDPLRRYWWAVLALIVLVGGWIAYPQMGGFLLGSGALAGVPAAPDQSLDSLETAPMPAASGVQGAIGAPGSPMSGIVASVAGAESDAKPASMASENPPGSGGSAAASNDAPSSANGSSAQSSAGVPGSLAAALKQVADFGKPESLKRGTLSAYAAPLQRPQAHFGALGASFGGSGGSGPSVSAAAPFSSNFSHPEVTQVGGSSTRPDPTPPSAAVHNGPGMAMGELYASKALAMGAAASGSAEASFGLTGHGFAGLQLMGASRGSSSGATAGPGVFVGANDALIPKELKMGATPVQQPQSPVPNPQQQQRLMQQEMQQQQQQQMESMLLQGIMGGVLGPMMGGMGSSLAMGMGGMMMGGMGGMGMGGMGYGGNGMYGGSYNPMGMGGYYGR